MDRYRVAPESRIDLSATDPDDRSEFSGSKSEGKAACAELNQRLEALQERLFAEGRHKVLVVLQGMDTSGKDGVIRHVFDGVNPQGVKVANFRKPTEEELAHDFLWRVHRHTPGKGEIAIFNRSHYEDVLVVRVKELVPEAIWQARYGQINGFERTLVEDGATIVKFFLHIGPDEQRERLQARVDEPEKRWKFRRGDLDDRKLWPEFLAAYGDALGRTSTEHAPWYIVPSDRKWYRNLVVSTVLVHALEALDMQTPPAEPGIEGIRVV